MNWKSERDLTSHRSLACQARERFGALLKGLLPAIMGLFLFGRVIALSGAPAGACTVPSAPHPTIQAAVDDAACDPILLGALVFNEDVTVARDVTIQGQDLASTIVAGTGGGPVFTVQAGLDVTLADLTIRDGNGTLGGGVLSLTSTLTIRNALVVDNAAERGAGIYVQAGTLLLESSQVFSNHASLLGGGIAGTANTPLFIGDTILTGNSATALGGAVVGFPVTIDGSSIVDNASDSFGGGVYGRATLRDSLVAENRSDRGAGLYTFLLTATNSTISGNVATTGGGGIYVFLNSNGSLERCTVQGNAGGAEGGGVWLGNNSDFRVDRSTLSGNSASNGGGAYVTEQSRWYLSTSTVSGNMAATGGGVALNASSSAAISNTTIAYNSASNAGGGLNGAGFSLINTVVANSVMGGDCSGTVNSLGHNLDSDNSCNLTSAGDLPGANPLLEPLQNNGGSTLTHALLSGSPAIDTGDNANCPSPDQRGIFRPFDGNGSGTSECDIGAYELGVFLPLRSFLPLVLDFE